MKLNEKILNIENRSDFVVFVNALAVDLKQNPEKWENQDLCHFLEALAAWVNDMDGYYVNQKRPFPENIPWRVFADILMGAKVYE